MKIYLKYQCNKQQTKEPIDITLDPSESLYPEHYIDYDEEFNRVLAFGGTDTKLIAQLLSFCGFMWVPNNIDTKASIEHMPRAIIEVMQEKEDIMLIHETRPALVVGTEIPEHDIAEEASNNFYNHVNRRFLIKI